MSEPITKEDKYMAKILGEYDGELPEPFTRKEKYMYQMAKNGGVSDERLSEAVENAMSDTFVKKDDLDSQVNELLTNNFVTPEMYGAVGDGVTDDTKAIQSAFDSKKMVVFSSEKIYATQSLQIKSNAYIQFNGCTLKMIGSKYRLLEIYEIPNVTIENVVLIESDSWTYDEANYGGFIRAVGCDYLTINNVKAFNKNSRYVKETQHTAWTFTLSGNHIVVKNCYIDAYDFGGWGDGIHIGYSNDCEIYGCTVLAGDDAIAVAQAYYMNNIGFPNGEVFSSACKDEVMMNVNIHNCVLSSACANALRLGIGVNAETDYPNYELNNFKFHDNTILGCKNVIEFRDNRTGVSTRYNNLEFYSNTVNSDGHYGTLDLNEWVEGINNFIIVIHETLEAKAKNVHFHDNIIQPLAITNRLTEDIRGCMLDIFFRNNIIDTVFLKYPLMLYNDVNYVFEKNKITRQENSESTPFLSIQSSNNDNIRLTFIDNEINDEVTVARFSPIFLGGNFIIKGNVFNTKNSDFVWCFKGDYNVKVDGNTFNNEVLATLGIIYISTPTFEDVSEFVATRNLVLNSQLALLKAYYASDSWVKMKKIVVMGNVIPQCEYLTTVNSLNVPITNYELATTMIVE